MPPIDSVTQVGSPANKFVVFRRTKESNDAQFDDEIVHDLLRLLLGEHARCEIAVEVNVEKCRNPAQRHCGAVLFLYRCQVGEVKPLHCFARVARRVGDIEAVTCRHLLSSSARESVR